MDQLGITVFDVAVIAVAVFGAAIGSSAGFAHAVLFIASWLVSAWIAYNYSSVVEPELMKLIQNAEITRFGAVLVVFVAALIVTILLTNALSRAIRASPLARPDRILGAGFGVLCAWVAMGAAFLFYNYVGPKPLPPPVEGGATFPLIKEMAGYVDTYLPQGWRERLKSGSSKVDIIPTPDPPATKPTQ